MKRVLVIGYASLDRSMGVDTFQGAGRTSLVTRPGGGPEPGGIARLFAGLADHSPAAVSWVGQDEASAQWIGALQRRGVNTEAVQQLDGHMPTSFLFHADSGDTMCFFDAGIADPTGMQLSTSAVEAIRNADVVIVAVGPHAACEQALDVLPPAAELVWVVKADPQAFPVTTRRRLIARADAVLHSHQEDAFMREAWSSEFPGLVIRTAGADSVQWTHGADAGLAPVEPVSVSTDATGAGDWFAGHFVGAYVAGNSVDYSVAHAVRASHAYLVGRGRDLVNS